MALCLLTAHSAFGDDIATLRQRFTAAKVGDTIDIPPGDYHLDGKQSMPLSLG